jgi:hypothetical protein
MLLDVRVNEFGDSGIAAQDGEQRPSAEVGAGFEPVVTVWVRCNLHDRLLAQRALPQHQPEARRRERWYEKNVIPDNWRAQVMQESLATEKKGSG